MCVDGRAFRHRHQCRARVCLDLVFDLHNFVDNHLKKNEENKEKENQKAKPTTPAEYVANQFEIPWVRELLRQVNYLAKEEASRSGGLPITYTYDVF